MSETLELDMRGAYKAVRKQAWLVVLCAVLAGALFFTYTFCFVAPQYQANVTIYVNNGTNNNSGSISSTDLAVALRLVTTYVNILKSDTVLEKVIENAGLELSARDVRAMVTAEPVEETEMFMVKVTAPDPYQAAKIANSIAAVAPAEIATIIDGSAAKIIDYAKVPQERHSPSYTINTIIGVLVGALLAMVYVILREVLDTHVKDEEDLAKISAIPVIGLIPEMVDDQKSSGNGIRFLKK